MRRLAFLLALLWPTLAAAQQGVTTYPAPWNQVGPLVSLTVTTNSASAQLGWVGFKATPPAPPTAWVCNIGTVTAYVALGDSTVAATATNFPVFSGACNPLAIDGAKYIAAITTAGSTTLTVSSGVGSPQSPSCAITCATWARG